MADLFGDCAEMRPTYNLICVVSNSLLFQSIEGIESHLVQGLTVRFGHHSTGIMDELTDSFSREECPPTFFTMSLNLTLSNASGSWKRNYLAALPVQDNVNRIFRQQLLQYLKLSSQMLK